MREMSCFSIFDVFRHNVFDAEKIESCLKMMEGSHNFRNFCSSTGWIKHLKLPDGSHLASPRTEEEFIKDISSIGKYKFNLFKRDFLPMLKKNATTYNAT